MITHCYSVRDKAVEAFLPPFFVRHTGEAIRSFADAVLDEKHQFNKHSSDYTMYHIGTFDDVSGVFSALADPVRVISALEIATPSPSISPTKDR